MTEATTSAVRLDRAALVLPTGKTFAASLDVDQVGASLSASYRPKPPVVLTGFADYTWKTKDVRIGARVGVTW